MSSFSEANPRNPSIVGIDEPNAPVGWANAAGATDVVFISEGEGRRKADAGMYVSARSLPEVARTMSAT